MGNLNEINSNLLSSDANKRDNVTVTPTVDNNLRGSS